LQTNDLFFSYNVQFVYEYYRINNKKNILYVFNAAASYAVVPISYGFFKGLFSLRSPQPLFGNFLVRFSLYNLL